MSFDIQGKVALVTGANRGIGKQYVETFLEHGAAKVYAAVRNLDSAQPLVAKYGDRVVPVRLDVADNATVKAAAQEASDVDVVINNAGILRTANPLEEKALDTLSEEINVNVAGLLRVAQAFAPILAKNGGGALANLNSVASLKNFAAFATYAASKSAAYSITQGLRDTLKEQGTIVVSVHPGPIATDMASSAGFTEVAEPPTLVTEATLQAFKNGDFHVFPDTMAKQVGAAYQSFAENVIDADFSGE
ncbi:SDR family oxidoreductase [Acanthopleuribacter pedis]|uniref:SDR family oxidoreductase n=1 Tax=Acanthopleuribacter pedis TaxID=442870 RepID=A0A8J7QG08_9BACT|nr:SDR family oxidoreductase [Acanthopleuribacter pedis]MBO1319325.1 SDR family oxidoreductase [Acanthopleuribacter pedis]